MYAALDERLGYREMHKIRGNDRYEVYAFVSGKRSLPLGHFLVGAVHAGRVQMQHLALLLRFGRIR